MSKDPHYLGYLDENDLEADNKNKGNVSKIRITKGVTKYKLPWYRRLFMKLFGKSHL